MFKRVLSRVLMSTMILSLIVGCNAIAFGANSAVPSKISVKVNNRAIKFSHTPIMTANVIIAPSSEMAKALGATYKYNSKTKTITISKAKTTIVMKIGSKYATVNRKKFNMGASSKLNKVTFIPVKFIGVKLGYTYSYVSKTKTVYFKRYVAKPSATPKPAATMLPTKVATPTVKPTTIPTAMPTNIATPIPTSNGTPMPTANATPSPTANTTPLPTAIVTSLPIATSTHIPMPTVVIAAAKVTVSSASGKANDTVKVYVSITANSAMGAANFTLNYDKSLLDCTSAVIGSALNTGVADVFNDRESGNVAIAYISVDPMNNAGKILEMEFKIRDNVSPQKINLIVTASIIKPNFDNVPCAVTNGSITVIRS